MVTKSEYEAASKVVKEYESQLERELKTTLVKIKADLTEYFKDNLVCGTTIKKFFIERCHNGNDGVPRIEIYSEIPYFDEDYEDDEADNEIEAIGNKYNVQLGWELGVYSK